MINESANALNFSLIGVSSCTAITLRGDGATVGTVWAPHAQLTLNGIGARQRRLLKAIAVPEGQLSGGGNAGSFIGAAIVNSAKFNGADFHYDENLGRNGPVNGFQVYGWNEL